MGDSMYKIIIKLIFVLVCMISIFILSSDSGNASSKKSDTLIINIYKLLHKKSISQTKQQNIINKNVFFVRKSAHFIIYSLLGLSLISLIREFRIININSILICLIIAFLYAFSDEAHQIFVPGRSCELLDVFIDTFGSFIGMYVYLLVYKLRRRKI